MPRFGRSLLLIYVLCIFDLYCFGHKRYTSRGTYYTTFPQPIQPSRMKAITKLQVKLCWDNHFRMYVVYCMKNSTFTMRERSFYSFTQLIALMVFWGFQPSPCQEEFYTWLSVMAYLFPRDLFFDSSLNYQKNEGCYILSEMETRKFLNQFKKSRKKVVQYKLDKHSRF